MISQDTSTVVAELQSHPQWIVRDAHKHPYNARTGNPAKANDPTTWTDYKTALAALETHPDRYAGLGYEFRKDQGITGVDLDHCIDDQGNIDQWAQEILDQLGSYAEFSPNDGVHIFVRAALPETCRHKIGMTGMRHPKAAIEMYDEGRYFTVTGKHVPGTPSTIESRQAALDRLMAAHTRTDETTRPGPRPAAHAAPIDTDAALIDKAKQAANGDKFRDLWDGTRSDYHTQSEADLALCTLLAFWTGKDAARIDRLFRQSGLFREKWDRAARSGETYGEGTIKRAIDACTEVYDPSAVRSGLPEIILTGLQLREKREKALAALVQAEQKQKSIFIHAHRIVSLSLDKKQRPIIREIETAEMKNRLTDAADFYSAKRKNTEEVILSEVSPPKELAETILSLSPHALPFPAINGIVELPIVRPDGTICDTPGYDEESGLFYAANKQMQACQIPWSPTREDIQQARELLDQCFGEFCYETQADFANYMGLLITIVTRYMYTGDVQHAIINATKPGTGKTLLVHAACIIATGVTAAIRDFPQKEEETKKVIDAKILGGQNIIIFDNIKRRVESSSLDALATGGGRYSLRPLGQSKDITIDNVRCTVMLTGNNIQVDSDQARRCFIVRLTSPVSRPDEREDFTIKDLIAHCSTHRAALVRALLILVRAWFVAGKPDGKNKIARSSSTFNFWAKTVGGILENAGIEGFLDNRESLRADANEEETQTDAFLHAWKDSFGEGWIPAKQIVEKICSGPDGLPAALPANLLFETMPDGLKIALQEKPKVFTMVLSKWLQKRVKTPFGEDNIRIERDEDKHTKMKVWRVFAGSAGSVGGQSQLLRARNFPSHNSGINIKGKDPEVTTSTTRNEEVEKVALGGSTSGTKHTVPPQNLQVVLDHYPQENLQALYGELKAAIAEKRLAPRGELMWYLPGSGYAQELIPVRDYLQRVLELAKSDDQARRELAKEEMLYRLGRGDRPC